MLFNFHSSKVNYIPCYFTMKWEGIYIALLWTANNSHISLLENRLWEQQITPIYHYFVSLYGTLYFCTRNDACGLLATWLGKKLYFYIWTLVCLPRALRIWDNCLCNDSLWHGNSGYINGSGTIMFFLVDAHAAAIGLAELRVSNWRI